MGEIIKLEAYEKQGYVALFLCQFAELEQQPYASGKEFQARRYTSPDEAESRPRGFRVNPKHHRPCRVDC